MQLKQFLYFMYLNAHEGDTLCVIQTGINTNTCDYVNTFYKLQSVICI